MYAEIAWQDLNENCTASGCTLSTGPGNAITATHGFAANGCGSGISLGTRGGPSERSESGSAIESANKRASEHAIENATGTERERSSSNSAIGTAPEARTGKATEIGLEAAETPPLF